MMIGCLLQIQTITFLSMKRNRVREIRKELGGVNF